MIQATLKRVKARGRREYVGTDSGPTMLGPQAIVDATDPRHRLMTHENKSIGVIIVDHGSRRAEANLRHEDFVSAWRAHSGYQIVEPAHLEFAHPSISASIDVCVAAGATELVILPLFLWPGAHLERDIPALVAQTVARHPGVGYVIGPPLGQHPLLVQIVDDHVTSSVGHLDRPS